ncbi:MAG: hypothetical protein A2252_06090 [Elusimicrobia bacterium RIFOXYA2_FULL_39_19]|nr:MAG: hypothetical protein A2252_06090 [Elusimicrobia bacterium RIFOXYA2_FULL_39_19]
MQKVRYGIIGLGFFGEKHAEVLYDMPNVELAAISTRRADRCKEIAQRFGAKKTYTNYKDLLADKDIDAVSIVTHVDDHRDMTIEALDAGKHVFLEKPMAPNVKDCDAIVTAAKKAKGYFMVGHICRFDSRVAQAKKAVEDGVIGKIVSMHATRNLPANISAGVLDKISPLMGDGIHDTDIMLWLTKSKVKTVYAQNVRVRNFKNPDIGWAMYTFEGGAVGVIETVWYLPENTPYAIDARMEIIGEKGAIYIDAGNSGLIINDSTGFHKPDTVYWPGFFGKRIGVLRTELDYFITCLVNNKRPDIITPEESKMAVEVIESAEKSAATGKVVTL